MAGRHEWVYANGNALREALNKRNLTLSSVSILMGYSSGSAFKNLTQESKISKRTYNALTGYLATNGMSFTEAEKSEIFDDPKVKAPVVKEDVSSIDNECLQKILCELQTLNKSVASITAEQLVQGRYLQEMKSKVERAEGNICKIEKRVTYMGGLNGR